MTNDDENKLYVPWTKEHVKKLQEYQNAGYVHEYTCGGAHCREPLVPGTDGWACDRCGYVQNWCMKMHALIGPGPHPNKYFKLHQEKVELIRQLYGVFLQLADMEIEAGSHGFILKEDDKRFWLALCGHPDIQKLYEGG